MNLPNKIRILEVGPRDGFQNLKTFIETKHKIEIIDALAGAGLQSIEATSFVNPKWVPQMADAKEVCAYCAQRVDKTYELAVLVPNGKGVENALAAGAEKITMVISVSEAHNKANVNRTVEESFQEFEKIVKTYPNGRFRLALATVFGCPFGEEIRTERVTELLKRAKDTGLREIMLADTVGLGNPVLVENILSEVKREVGTEDIILHIHDTRGMGLANMLAAMQLGFSAFETSIGGLGGCPFAPGAAGNVATEDFVNMLNGMGISHGVSLEGLYATLDLLERYIDVGISNSHMAQMYRGRKGHSMN